MSLPAPLAIVALSCLVIVMVEVLTVVLVFNTSGFKRLVSDIDRTTKELERISSTGAASATTTQKKRERTLEMQLTYMTRDFYYYRMRQYVITSLSLLSMFYVLRTWYKGKSIATLPFVPMFPFSRLAHQFLEKPAAADCGFMFLYVICNIGIKPNVAKLLGTQLPANVQKATDLQNMVSRFSRLTAVKAH
ncbi:hypothetical protein Vretimale_4676 [Volvox reticuliferus]|uniref:Uncharacterized protein n=1 Tax=Volvox reticuliferus TaxID=1737510 RepID=A0A8J4DG39_9CHLO|nr:hypothetical protein Vretifemale_3277 [Volvox reticuliferus]GIL99524.1 hypothetical protein Vretimale_4676 [Volvox reticuliferus]